MENWYFVHRTKGLAMFDSELWLFDKRDIELVIYDTVSSWEYRLIWGIVWPICEVSEHVRSEARQKIGDLVYLRTQMKLLLYFYILLLLIFFVSYIQVFEHTFGIRYYIVQVEHRLTLPRFTSLCKAFLNFVPKSLIRKLLLKTVKKKIGCL